MKIVRVLSCLFVAAASAQDVQWKLVDTGTLNHSSRGNGIEMRIQPDPVLDVFFGNENLDDLVLAICNHYAPSVIPFVQQKFDIKEPDFITVRIISGGSVGIYRLNFYEIKNRHCGTPL